MTTANPIPDGGYLIITLPTDASADSTSLSITCIQGCLDNYSPSLTYSSTANTITLRNIFTYSSSTVKYYVDIAQTIEFTLNGFVNPPS